MKQQLKKISLADIERIEIVNGKRIFPTGDYSNIKEFNGNSIFGAYSQFADETVFGYATSFGQQCKFGNNSTFGNRTEFGFGCTIGEKSNLGESCYIGACSYIGEGSTIGKFAQVASGCFINSYCTFSYGCIFADTLSKIGQFCNFGDMCRFPEKTVFPNGTTFGASCSFGAGSEFAEGCMCENGHEFIDMFTVGQVGKKKETIYFWLLADGRILVRCGEIIGTLAEFVIEVRKSRWNDNNAKDYILAINYAISKLTFNCNHYDSVWIN